MDEINQEIPDKLYCGIFEVNLSGIKIEIYFKGQIILKQIFYSIFIRSNFKP